MAAITIPGQMRAGDSIAFTHTLESHSADDGWALSYSIVNNNNQYTLDSSGVGGVFTFEVGGNVTRDFKPGAYKWFCFVSKGFDRKTIGLGEVEILPDITSASASHISHAEIVLQAVEASLENKATKDQQELSINGRNIKRYTFDELLKLRSQYRAEVKSIKRAEARKMGRNASSTIKVRL